LIFSDYRGFGDANTAYIALYRLMNPGSGLTDLQILNMITGAQQQADITVWRLSHPDTGLTDIQIAQEVLKEKAATSAAVAAANDLLYQKRMKKLTGGQSLINTVVQETVTPDRPVVDLDKIFTTKMQKQVRADRPTVTADSGTASSGLIDGGVPNLPIPGTGLTIASVSPGYFSSIPTPVLVVGGLAAAFAAYKFISKK
jgi:hypothetical protein